VKEPPRAALGQVGIALNFGLAVFTMILAIGDLSGAHLNPAATLAFSACGQFPRKSVAPYLIAQTLGGLTASGFLRFLFPTHATLGATFPASSPAQSFVLEFLMTFSLMLTVLHLCCGARQRGLPVALAAGGVVALAALFGGPISGASLNPARSLGPALWSGRFDFFWVYLTAPVLGALCAIPVCRAGRAEGCCRAEFPPSTS